MAPRNNIVLNFGMVGAEQGTFLTRGAVEECRILWPTFFSGWWGFWQHFFLDGGTP